MTTLLERRYLPLQIEPISVTARAGGHKTISGYAAVFHRSDDPRTQCAIADGVVERIRPGAFDRALREAHDVRALYNHSPDNLLGRTSSGTLRLSVDSRGLRYEVDFDPKDSDHQRVLVKIERGDLTGSSFAFRASAVTWEDNQGEDSIRWVEDVTLYDVGPVTYPAYSATTTGLRSEHEIKTLLDERDSWVAFERRKAQWASLKALIAGERDATASRRAKLEQLKAAAAEDCAYSRRRAQLAEMKAKL